MKKQNRNTHTKKHTFKHVPFLVLDSLKCVLVNSPFFSSSFLGDDTVGGAGRSQRLHDTVVLDHVPGLVFHGNFEGSELKVWESSLELLGREVRRSAQVREQIVSHGLLLAVSSQVHEPVGQGSFGQSGLVIGELLAHNRVNVRG